MAEVAAGDVILEIGPGRGAMTQLLAAQAAHVFAFEIDRDLVPQLKATAAAERDGRPGRLSGSDGRQHSRANCCAWVFGRAPLRAAGNLPYNVASPILFKLLALRRDGLPIADAQAMLQREVADRLTASPGTKDYGVLSVLIGHHADVERVLALPPGAFRPAPKVHSAVVRLRFHAPDPPPHDAAVFTAMTKAIFTRRRKTLANALLAYRSDGASTKRLSAHGTGRPSAAGNPRRSRSSSRCPMRLSDAALVGGCAVFTPNRSDTPLVGRRSSCAIVWRLSDCGVAALARPIKRRHPAS